MTVVTIKNVPDEIVDDLKTKAARAGQSLQGYLRHLLERDAATISPADVAELAAENAWLDLSNIDVSEIIRAGRERR